MDILLGLSILAVTSLLLSFAYGAHRRPIPAKWVHVPGASMLICVTLTLMAPVALGFFVKAAISPAQELASLSVTGAVVTVALIALAFVASPILSRPARQKPALSKAPIADNFNSAPAQDAVISA